MAGYSNVELVNQALDHLGKDRIASLSESSTAARKMNEMFERTIFSALARSHWSFARRIQSLSSLANDWDERWAYKYDLPNDCLNFVRIIPRVDIPNTEPQAPHQLMGGAVYCDELEAKAEYVFETTNTSLFSQPFLDACSYLLARNAAMPLTRKQGMYQGLNEAYEAQLGLAIEHDAGQEPTSWAQAGGGYIEARGGAETEIEGAAPDGSIYWR